MEYAFHARHDRDPDRGAAEDKQRPESFHELNLSRAREGYHSPTCS
jgi:hypothetical protein